MVTPRARRMLRWIRRTLIVLLLFLFVSTGGYVSMAFMPSGFPESVLQSDASVTVDARADALAFVPVTDRGQPGLILYPGCPVPAEAYAPLARDLAGRGHPVLIMRIAYRCATRDEQQRELFDRTAALIRGDRRGWVLAGHSHGGALASRFAFDHPYFLKGLVLMGSGHPRAVDLSALHLPITVVFGSRDGVATERVVLGNRARLPASTRWVRIEGGNHVQFAYYRFQLWDHPAAISRDAQQAQTVAAVLDALRR